MRVSVVNFCSVAYDMLQFSTEMLLRNAGTDKFDYFVITWNPSPEVAEYVEHHPQISPMSYHTDESLEFVPNLRKMMSYGFTTGLTVNNYVCAVNTDMAFGRDWLVNLMRRATEEIIPNSLHLSPIVGPNIITANLGRTAAGHFNVDAFWTKHDELFEHKIETEKQRRGWRATNTFPYVMYRRWWEDCGPWEPHFNPKEEAPDRMFFDRVHRAGGQHILCYDSICYHHEAVERRESRPVGIEKMAEGR